MNCLTDDQLRNEAKAIQFATRKDILSKKTEVDLHELLRELFCAMDPNLEVNITHGPKELGKDLVIIRRDGIGSTTRAVVVKRGDIKGTAGGPIDDIRSQVNMSLVHPYSPNGVD